MHMSVIFTFKHFMIKVLYIIKYAVHLQFVTVS